MRQPCLSVASAQAAPPQKCLGTEEATLFPSFPFIHFRPSYQVTGTVRVHSCPAWQRLQTPEAMSEAEEAKNVQDGEEEEDEVAVVKEEESTAVFEPVVRLSMSTVLSFFVLLRSF